MPNIYEQYLLNQFKIPTMQDNPYTIGSDTTRVMPNWDSSAQIQGELANKPVYDQRGGRYGNTLSDDMFDIKNNRVGNYTDESKPMSKHPWTGDMYDYSNIGALPELQQAENSPYEELVARYPLLFGRDDGLVSRKKNVTGDSVDWEKFGPSAIGDYEGYLFENSDYGDFYDSLNDYRRLQQQINDLRTGSPNNNLADGIEDDVRYIKSGGKTLHVQGEQGPRNTSEWDPALPTYPEDEWGLLVNPDRLSPATAQLIAQNTTQDRPEYNDYWGSKSGLNPIINEYRRRLGMTNPAPVGTTGNYLQRSY